MTTLSVRLTDSIHKKMKEISKKDHISLNQFIATAVSEKVSLFLAEDYLLNRGKKASHNQYLSVLKKVKKRKAFSEDVL